MGEPDLDRRAITETKLEFKARRFQRRIRRQSLRLGCQEYARRSLDASAVVAVSGLQSNRYTLPFGSDGGFDQLLSTGLVTGAGALSTLSNLAHEIEEQPMEQVAHLKRM